MTGDNLRVLIERGIKQLNLDLTGRQVKQLLDYLELIRKWNRSYNLTMVSSPEQMLGRHVLDSLALLPHVQGKTVLDIGSGAGLPGIPLAIALPGASVVLLDSGGKKVRFLNHVIRTLKLTSASTVHERIEAYQPEVCPDIICARALAALPRVLEWCDHLVGPETRLLAMKGRYPEQELLALPAGFMIDEVIVLAVPGESSERHLVIIRLDNSKKK